MTAIATPCASEDEGPRQQWRTPRELFDVWHARWSFDVDAAANDRNHLLPEYWTVREDGIKQLYDSPHRAFVNPPYGDIGPWVQACEQRCRLRSVLSVLLLPSRTDQRWFHSLARWGELWFSRGRVRFVAPDGVTESSNREGSVLVVFDPSTYGERIVRAFDAQTGARVP